MPRKPLSIKYPFLSPHIQTLRTTVKSIQYLQPRFKTIQDERKANFRIYKHKSLLRKRLGDSDPHLQESKIKNLALATEAFNNQQILPNQTFSFWKNLGPPKYNRGFVDGMLIDAGKVVVGPGGGLCQIANLLYWIGLHSNLKVVEHHHHMLDIFPDSVRVLPFGSGAGILYNYGDLQFYNPTNEIFTFKTWLDDEFLHGELYSNVRHLQTYSVTEEDHYFYEKNGQTRRTNKLYKVIMVREGGSFISKQLITHNDSEVLYEIDKNKVHFRHFED